MLSEIDFCILLNVIDNAKADDQIEGIPHQLRPSAWRNRLYHKGGWDQDPHYILDGVQYGFHVVNRHANMDQYCMNNYWSCYKESTESKLSSLGEMEIACGKLSLSSELPRCIHAMGAIRKGTGLYRPINDCSRPEGNSVNCYMDEIIQPFSFITVQGILQDIQEGDFLSVVDLQSAYRSVAIHPRDRCYFSLCWHSSEGALIILNDNFLCFE